MIVRTTISNLYRLRWLGPTLNIASDYRTVGLTSERTITLGLGLGVQYSPLVR